MVVVYCECYMAMSCVSVCARVHVCMFDVGLAVWLFGLVLLFELFVILMLLSFSAYAVSAWV